MPLTLMPNTESEPLLWRLHSLRTRLRFMLITREGCRTLAVALAAISLFAWLDYRYQLPSLVRGLALVGTLTAIGLLFIYRIIRPLQRGHDALAMAHLVERKF